MTDQNTSLIDPVDLAQALVRCPSVTPKDAGALGVLQKALETIGFACTRLPFSDSDTPDIDNLFAKIGSGAPHFCFAGHTDVVPVGALGDWSDDPFSGQVSDGVLLGRGAADMKGAIGAFAAAASQFLAAHQQGFGGTISFLITGDEEGPAVNGTQKMLTWLGAQGEKIDHCLVGEPTNLQDVGDMVKIGRRGSLNGILTITGRQGHVAYPHLAQNPIPILLAILGRLQACDLDQGNEHFQPSNLEIVSIDVGNEATNVIPAQAVARFNIRFNNEQSGPALKAWLRGICDNVVQTKGGAFDLKVSISGDAFLTVPGPFTDLISGAVKKVTGRTPDLSTSGGTSDARFIKDHCAVAEFGLTNKTMHKVDEQVPVQDITDLTAIYKAILDGYFSAPI